GTASIYAGLPEAASHRLVVTLNAGESYVVTGLAAGEVLSVQNGNAFAYVLTLPAPPTETPTPTPTETPTAVVPPGSAASELVTWTCTGSPCDWGSPLSGHAVVWPEELGASSSRLGYTTSAGIYVPASTGSGVTIQITAGTASIYAGLPEAASHRFVVTLNAGESYVVTGLAAGEVLSVQNGNAFAYVLTLPAPPTETPTPTPTETPTATPTEPACTDPLTCNPVSAIPAYWQCNTAGCSDPPWLGAVITWPSWAAYENNARAGDQSRTVFSTQGEMLYPYMGAWATGCEVTAVVGTTLIIEWERGTDVWRATYLQPGESYTISLYGSEDGAMIEGVDGLLEPFSVSLNNCNPENIRAVEPSETQDDEVAGADGGGGDEEPNAGE
ncbi:MAG: hypothetical protein ACK47M_10450, partial [Caldilinea sp.]